MQLLKGVNWSIIVGLIRKNKIFVVIKAIGTKSKTQNKKRNTKLEIYHQKPKACFEIVFGNFVFAYDVEHYLPNQKKRGQNRQKNSTKKKKKKRA